MYRPWGQLIIVILSDAVWLEENVLGGFHDLIVQLLFLGLLPGGFNDTLCANLMAQQQGNDVRFNQRRDTKQIIKLNDLRKEYG